MSTKVDGQDGKQKAIIKSVDMPEDLQEDAVRTILDALEKNQLEKDVAAFIKKDFDSRHSPTWHVIVGRNFGSYVTHQTGHFLYAYVKDVAILLFKSG